MTVFLQFQNMIVFHMGIWQVHAILKELVHRAVKETHVCFLLSWSIELFFFLKFNGGRLSPPENLFIWLKRPQCTKSDWVSRTKTLAFTIEFEVEIEISRRKNGLASP
jgi:hypothetical protein